MTLTHDVLIAGAGIIGLFIAQCGLAFVIFSIIGFIWKFGFIAYSVAVLRT